MMRDLLETLLNGHPDFEEFIKVRIEQAQLNRELEQLEGQMEDHDQELFRMSDEQAIEQAKAKRIALRDRRQFLRVAIIEQEGTVRDITKCYLESIMIILRSRPVGEYREFLNACLQGLDHEAITEEDRQEFTEDVLQAFGKE